MKILKKLLINKSVFLAIIFFTFVGLFLFFSSQTTHIKLVLKCKNINQTVPLMSKIQNLNIESKLNILTELRKRWQKGNIDTAHLSNQTDKGKDFFSVTLFDRFVSSDGKFDQKCLNQELYQAMDNDFFFHSEMFKIDQEINSPEKFYFTISQEIKSETQIYTVLSNLRCEFLEKSKECTLRNYNFLKDFEKYYNNAIEKQTVNYFRRLFNNNIFLPKVSDEFWAEIEKLFEQFDFVEFKKINSSKDLAKND